MKGMKIFQQSMKYKNNDQDYPKYMSETEHSSSSCKDENSAKIEQGELSYFVQTTIFI